MFSCCSKQLVKGRNREVPKGAAPFSWNACLGAHPHRDEKLMTVQENHSCCGSSNECGRAPQDFLILMDSPHTLEMYSPCQEHYSTRGSRISSQTQNLRLLPNKSDQ